MQVSHLVSRSTKNFGKTKFSYAKSNMYIVHCCTCHIHYSKTFFSVANNMCEQRALTGLHARFLKLQYYSILEEDISSRKKYQEMKLDKANNLNVVEMWRVKLQLDFGNSTPKQSLVDTCVCASSRTTVHIYYLLQRRG